MADLSAVISLGYGRQPIMAPNPTLFANLNLGEVPKVGESLTRSITLLRQVSDEVLIGSANTVSATESTTSGPITDAHNAGTARYLWSGSPGPTHDGTSWTNAWTTLSAANSGIQRGQTLAVAGGSYAGGTFSKATSGSTMISVIKATVGDHGTSTGWSDSMGTTQAAFTSKITFTTSFWLFDGVTGGGPDNWDGSTTAFGFKITETSPTDPMIDLPNTTTNTTVRHVWLRGMAADGSGGGGSGNDGVNFGQSGANAPSGTFSYLFVDNVGRCPFFIPTFSASGVVIEYCLIGRFWAQETEGGAHGEVISTTDSRGDFTFRWNLVRDVKSTGGIMWDNHGFHSSRMNLYGNIFYDNPAYSTWNTQNAVLGGWTGGGNEDCFNYHVYNNTFVNVNGTGGLGGGSIEIFGINNMQRFGSNDAYNNLFYTCNSPDYTVFPTHNYNHYIASGGAHSEANGSSASSGDPFVNYTSLNFRLTSSAAGAIAAGTDLGSPYNVDMYGNTRTSWTRGAIEYVP